jgi:signal transduction histidine kinase
MTAAGFAWFLGNFGDWAVYLHWAVLAQLLLTYPTGRLSSSLERVAVPAAYAFAVVYPLVGRSGYATIAFAAGVATVAFSRYLSSSGPQRRARAAALGAACAYSLVLVVGAATRLGGVETERTVLWAYVVVVGLVALGLLADLLWGHWAQAAVAGLVVDLGEPGETGILRDKLARALGDPSLVVGYALGGADGYVDDSGRRVELPPPRAGRTVTPIDQDGERIAVLVHDPAVLTEPGLVESVAAAARIAVANVRLQAELQARVSEVESSRRRIVEAGDSQRSRLEEELREGPERLLAHVGSLVEGSDVELERQLEAARTELREFARGIHPRTLTEDGLSAALSELAERSPIPVHVSAPPDRLGRSVEAAVYFVCSEALANVAKYANATQAGVRVDVRDGVVRAEVADDGIGGADPSLGSGLRGLADRVEALGGHFSVDSPEGRGTRVVAELERTAS